MDAHTTTGPTSHSQLLTSYNRTRHSTNLVGWLDVSGRRHLDQLILQPGPRRLSVLVETEEIKNRLWWLVVVVAAFLPS